MPRLLDPNLYRKGQLITALNRWLSLGLGGLALVYLWEHPQVQHWPAIAVGTAYAAFAVTSQFLQRRRGPSRPLKVAHDVADAVAVGCGAAFTNGIASPVWLLLYPHIVAVSVRGGLAYALSMGLLDALILAAVGWSSTSSFYGLYALSLVWCAFMAGAASSYLHDVQARLARVNDELGVKNVALEATLADKEASQREQERAMARLAQSETRYRKLLERIQDGVVIISGGRIVYVNQVFAQIAGDAPEGLEGADFRELIPAEDRRDIAERYRNWEEQQSTSGELVTRLRTRQGALLTVSLRAGSADYEGSRALIATVRDITRERRMEQDLKVHAARLAAINEVANAVNQTLQIEPILSVAAAEAQRLVPFDRLTIALRDETSPGLEIVAVGATARRYRASFRRDEVAWAFRRPLAWHEGGEEPLPARLHDLLADPGVRSASTLPLVSKDRVIGALCLGRFAPEPFAPGDIAVMEPVASHIAIALDNARLLEAVRRRGREFESLLEIGRRFTERLELAEVLPLVTRSVNRILGTHFCVLLLREGDVLNVAAQEGLEPDVIASFKDMRVGESLSGWVAREGRPLAVPDMRADPRLKYAESVQRYGYRAFLCVPLMRGSEVLGTLEVVTKEEHGFSADEQDVLTAFADQAAVAIEHARLFNKTRAHVEELAAANRRLEELDRLRQEYLRNVSHEFRTPLTVIRGYAEYITGSDPAPSETALRDVMRIVTESCDRLIDMVDTLIEVSRIEQAGGSAVLMVRGLELRSLVVGAIESLRATAERRGITLLLEFPEQALALEGDSQLLQQLVRKLADNAVKYSPAGARVALRGRVEDDCAVLEVEDAGIGIAPEHLARIFEKFYVVDGGLTRRVGGSGVGLYLVREIVKLHGGEVTVSSRVGEGSLFRVRLPRSYRSAGAPVGA